MTVKWASTLDGRAAAADGTSQWITGTAARQRVHEQRAASDAILTGTGTVLADDPSLTARGDAGELLPHQPIPVVVGERAIPADAALRRHPAGLIETGTRDLDERARAIWTTAASGASSSRPGPTLVSAFIAAGLADEYAVYLAPTLLGGDRLAIGDLGIPTIADARRLRIDVRRAARRRPAHHRSPVRQPAKGELTCSPESSKSSARSSPGSRAGDAARITVRGAARGHPTRSTATRSRSAASA